RFAAAPAGGLSPYALRGAKATAGPSGLPGMIYAAAPAARGPRSLATAGLAVLLGTGVLAALAVGFSLALYRYPPAPLLLIGFAVVLLGALALAMLAHDAAIAIGVFLLAAVRFQPAPTDLLFAVLIAVGLATGRIDFRRLPSTAALLIGGFLTLNLVSAVDVVNPVRAASFFAITFYVAVFGLWFATYVSSVRRARLVVRAYIAAAVISALLSTLALLLPIPGHHLFTRIGRAEGLFKDPNVFGPFLVPAALILMEELLVPRLLSGRRTTKLASFL